VGEKRISDNISGVIYIPTADEIRKYSRPWPYRELIKSHDEPMTEKYPDSAHSHYVFKKGRTDRSLKTAIIMIIVGAVLVLIMIWIASQSNKYVSTIIIGGTIINSWDIGKFGPLLPYIDSAVKIIALMILLISAMSAFCLSRASVLLIRLRNHPLQN
jgi:hypothetical protein